VTVYIVQHGCYSSKHFVAVCSTRDKADKLAQLDSDGRVFECVIDENVDLYLQGYRAWCVYFKVDGSGEAETQWDIVAREPMQVSEGYVGNVCSWPATRPKPSRSRRTHGVCSWSIRS
jgi:hypothetical protein